MVYTFQYYVAVGTCILLIILCVVLFCFWNNLQDENKKLKEELKKEKAFKSLVEERFTLILSQENIPFNSVMVQIYYILGLCEE